jgi:hypothetical protein
MADALHGRKYGTRWMALCPVHECDGRLHKPSLGILERDGRVLVRCYAGCSQADVIAALRAHGLWLKHERPGRTPGERARLAREYVEAQRIHAEASYFADAVARMAEWALEELPPTDPERAVHAALLAGLRVSPETEYRAWLELNPTWAAALVSAGRKRARRLQMALARYLVAEVAHAA